MNSQRLLCVTDNNYSVRCLLCSSGIRDRAAMAPAYYHETLVTHQQTYFPLIKACPPVYNNNRYSEITYNWLTEVEVGQDNVTHTFLFVSLSLSSPPPLQPLIPNPPNSLLEYSSLGIYHKARDDKGDPKARFSMLGHVIWHHEDSLCSLALEGKIVFFFYFEFGKR